VRKAPGCSTRIALGFLVCGVALRQHLAEQLEVLVGGGEPGVVKGRLAGARRRVDQHVPPADAIAHRVPETGASIDPLRPDLVADDDLARAGGSAEGLLRGLVVLSGAHPLCPSSVPVSGMVRASVGHAISPAP
jgi:hypothetical protein